MSTKICSRCGGPLNLIRALTCIDSQGHVSGELIAVLEGGKTYALNVAVCLRCFTVELFISPPKTQTRVVGPPVQPRTPVKHPFKKSDPYKSIKGFDRKLWG
jgi:hypothetical protein